MPGPWLTGAREPSQPLVSLGRSKQEGQGTLRAGQTESGRERDESETYRRRASRGERDSLKASTAARGP